MRRVVAGSLITIIVAVAAGCQTTGIRPTEEPPDDLTVTRTFQARFDDVKLATQEALRDQTALRQIAGFDYSQPVESTSQTWKTPFRKVATRAMENGERKVTVKVEQKPEGVVVTARVAGGKPGDPARSVDLLDRIGNSIVLDRARR